MIKVGKTDKSTQFNSWEVLSSTKNSLSPTRKCRKWLFMPDSDCINIEVKSTSDLSKIDNKSEKAKKHKDDYKIRIQSELSTRASNWYKKKTILKKIQTPNSDNKRMSGILKNKNKINSNSISLRSNPRSKIEKESSQSSRQKDQSKSKFDVCNNL